MHIVLVIGDIRWYLLLEFFCNTCGICFCPKLNFYVYFRLVKTNQRGQSDNPFDVLVLVTNWSDVKRSRSTQIFLLNLHKTQWTHMPTYVKLVFKDIHWRLGGLFVVVTKHLIDLPVEEDSPCPKICSDRQTDLSLIISWPSVTLSIPVHQLL